MKMLVIGNDEQLNETFKEFFELHNHFCHTVNDKRTALLALYMKEFDVIVADLPFYEMDFFYFASVVATRPSDVPTKVFVMSANDLSSVERILARNENITVLTKRFSLESLLEKCCRVTA